MLHKQGSFQNYGSGAGGQRESTDAKKNCTNLQNSSTPTEHLFTKVTIQILTQTKLDKCSSCNLHLKNKFKLF